MEVDEAACFVRFTIIFATTRAEDSGWDYAMRVSYRSEFDFVDGLYIVLGGFANTEHFEVFTAFIVEIPLATKM